MSDFHLPVRPNIFVTLESELTWYFTYETLYKRHDNDYILQTSTYTPQTIKGTDTFKTTYLHDIYQADLAVCLCHSELGIKHSHKIQTLQNRVLRMVMPNKHRGMLKYHNPQRHEDTIRYRNTINYIFTSPFNTCTSTFLSVTFHNTCHPKDNIDISRENVTRTSSHNPRRKTVT